MAANDVKLSLESLGVNLPYSMEAEQAVLGAALLDAPGGNTLAYLAGGTELAVLDEVEGFALVSSAPGYGYVELDKIG